tara:strand:+ start:1156 stop:1689 length:534 start_codon:yes stop_codon:yes gene_type:complete
MLTRLLILLIFLIIAFGYLGAKISVKTENFKHSYIFWALYIVTIVTVIEIIFCIMMYVKYRTKDGEIGPRGFDGYPGQQGDDGKCDQGKCRIDLITLMIVKKLEDRFVMKLTEAEITKIHGEVENKKNINKMTYTQLKQIDDDITYQIEVTDDSTLEGRIDTNGYITALTDKIQIQQ